MKICVQLAVWNGSKYLPELFKSLVNQSYKDWQLIVLDNFSSDNSLEIIEKYAADFENKFQIIKSNKNIGFAGAHNQMYVRADSKYVFVLNQDVILESDVLENLYNYLENNHKIASVSPLLLRMENGRKTDLIDSLGLEVCKSRKVADIGAGKNLHDFIDEKETSRNVFGVSAAATMYLRSATDEVGNGKIFDNFFHSYQEDFDLAWRLRLHGYESAVFFGTKAYHFRSIRTNESNTIVNNIKHKANQPFFIKYQSYRNHLVTILKNEQWQNFMLDFIAIFWYELKKFIYYLFLDPKVLKGISEVWANKEIIISERKKVQSGNLESWREVGKWFV